VNAIIGDMAGIAASVAATVDQQNRPSRSWRKACITRRLKHAAAPKRWGALPATAGARSKAADVKQLADAVAAGAKNLEAEIRQFLADVQAA
jgi:methyl-accepting chemotaxis protein